ncbi:MAG: peptidoglycan-binding protein [Proteobacteria bacterium]|nr:peptidoglycan-binding protein [Pseudomonadota bacterium]
MPVSAKRKAVPRKPTPREKSKADKVVEKGMAFVNNQNPYCYGGSGDMLCKSAKSKVEYYKSKFGDASNWDHILGDDKDDNGRNWKWTLSEESTKYKLVDCSGLTRYCYQEIGVNLDHYSESQNTYGQNSGKKVDMSQAKPGDLLWKQNHCGLVGPDGKTAIEAKGWKWGCTYDRSITKFTNCYHLTGDEYTGQTDPEQPEQPEQPGPGDTPADGNLLTAAQARSAIIFNKQNAQDICTKIQELVGVTPDGSFGNETVQAIARWQKSKNIEADGMFGNISRATAGWGSSAPLGGAPAAGGSTGANTGSIQLTTSQIQSALSYNKRNNQSICKKIQNLVGVTPDGLFGAITINAIASWQHQKGLTPDGKFGPQSKAAAGF